MRAAAEPLPDDPDDRREDEIKVTRIPDSSNVSIYSVHGERKLDPLVPVSRPARRDVRLHHTGLSAPEYDRSFNNTQRTERNVTRTSQQQPRTSWPLSMTMTFNLSKKWYVQVIMLAFISEINQQCPRIGNSDCGCNREFFT
jgi:hypothetical protein